MTTMPSPSTSMSAPAVERPPVLEMRDVFDPARTIDAHLASVRGKTAALFECACLLGAHCAGLTGESAQALGRFGHAFGMGFQLCTIANDSGLMAMAARGAVNSFRKEVGASADK